MGARGEPFDKLKALSRVEGGRGTRDGRRPRLPALVPAIPAAVLLTASSAIALGAEPAAADASGEIKTAQIILEIVEANPAARPQVVKVQALDRSLPQKMIDKEVRIRTVDGKPVDGAPGKWRIEGLAPGTYDLLVETNTGKFEGYSLADLRPTDEPLKAEDGERIAELFEGTKTYEDEKRILKLSGGGAKAQALVELIRRGGTSLKPGIVTWRVERWSYRKVGEAWQRENDGHKVLRRFLVEDAKQFAGWNWNFVPELGAVELKAGEKREVKWTIPEKFDAAKGRAADAGADAPRGPPAKPAPGA